MKISVVIPARNEEAHIGPCLEALAAQDRPVDEVIIVDNQSTDQTPQIAANFAGVRIITEDRAGIAVARNTGFNATTGDVIARIDADTRVAHDWAAEIERYFEAHPDTAAITGAADYYGQRGLCRRFTRWWFIEGYFRSSRPFFAREVLWGSNMAIRRSAWEQVKGQVCDDATPYHEDMDLAAHLGPIARIDYDPHLNVEVSFRSIGNPFKLAKRYRRGLQTYWHALQLKKVS